MSMIAISTRNAPDAVKPYDIAGKIGDTLDRLPDVLRRELWFWQPGEVPEQIHRPPYFNQGVTRDQISDAKSAATARGSRLWFYIGTHGDIPEDDLAIEGAMSIYRGNSIAFDQAADDETNSLSHRLILKALSMGFRVAIEANARQPWIDELMAQFGRRITIAAEWWLWMSDNPKRYTIDDVRRAVAVPAVLVARKTRSDGGAVGFPNLPDDEWPAMKVTLTKEFIAQGAKVVLRTTGMTSEQVNDVARLMD